MLFTLKKVSIACFCVFFLTAISFVPSLDIHNNLTSSSECDGCVLRERRYQDVNSVRVALASFNGAGNTWARHLIEQVTGVYTGSVYKDGALKKMFPGEGVSPPDGRVSAIKTHQIVSFESYQKAIVLHRSFRESILSRFKFARTQQNHTGKLQETAFEGGDWRKVVSRATDRYVMFYDAWLVHFQGLILVLRYNDMVSDLFPQLVRIRDFLGSHATDYELKCIVCFKEGSFHREKDKNFDPWKYISGHLTDKARQTDEYVDNLLKNNKRSNVDIYSRAFNVGA